LASALSLPLTAHLEAGSMRHVSAAQDASGDPHNENAWMEDARMNRCGQFPAQRLRASRFGLQVA
jgi:hypothetical protein